jgi:ferritin-like metal-binding protein YciE
MQTGHELFVHGLADILDGERQLAEALRELSEDSTNAQLKKAFESHRRETEGQIERLNQCFELLGESPEETECLGIKGLLEEKKEFMEEDPANDILDIFHAGAAIKVESYEICEYTSLIQLAREMKHNKVAQLLGQNLREEQATLKKMEGFSKKLKPEEMMTEEQQQKSQAAAGKRPSRRAA